MRFMNEYDIERSMRETEFADAECSNPQPNRIKLLRAVNALRVWADENSDGWAYWPKPAKAAARAMEAIQPDVTRRAWELPDVTDADLTKALSPIKAFLTRQGADWKAILFHDTPTTR